MNTFEMTLEDKKLLPLEECILAIDRFDGVDYAAVLTCIGNAPHRVVLKNNMIERTWIDDGYSVCLLFDEHDICLGVWEETKD